MKIAAKSKDTPTVEVNYDFPPDLAGLVAQFGESVVYGKTVDAITIDVQAFVRRHAKGTDKVPAKTPDEIQTLVNNYKPGAGTTRATPVEKVSAMVGKMSPEEKKALLKALKGAQ